MDTPILLIAFNRFDTLLQVFNRVKQIRPRVLYIAVDGPRLGNEDDIINTNKVKSIVDYVDWECELHTRFLEKNLGCGYAPSSAISWAFENCEELIVLEDDCMPCLSFFSFCENMLTKYRDDKRVGMITGWSPLQGSKYFSGYSYLFSLVGNSLGWATWKDRWAQFDIEMGDFDIFNNENKSYDVIGSRLLSNHYNRHFLKRYKNIEAEKSHSWDTQWFYARYKNSYLSIVPFYNQIQYIGFDSGTHIPTSAKYLMIPSKELPSTITHPHFVTQNRQYTKNLFWKNQLRRYGLRNIISHVIDILKR